MDPLFHSIKTLLSRFEGHEVSFGVIGNVYRVYGKIKTQHLTLEFDYRATTIDNIVKAITGLIICVELA